MSRPKVDLSELPPTENSRLVWQRSDVANFRRVLAGQPTRPANPAADDKLVTVEQLARMIGVHPRTVRRRVGDARAQAAAADATVAKMRKIIE